ncbi:ribosomal protein L7/L12 [Scopulibacillus daqui]|uniref:Ribosomal protein L7/L12 n=1 Tax=Scopulibacillus daqui TaxID=1469162 RepID=A0ABS2PVY3_9BACL|nr:gamma-type small acid-soluble spore protein [Scopulibacillus daqui]MBM7643870.1 ribosomal protein L7/L12 [Scopulibacillus daqui]
MAIYPSQKSKLTLAGTDIEKVKRLNSQSGMSYNEAKAFIAKTTGGHHTDIYSDTDAEEVKRKIKSSGNP